MTNHRTLLGSVAVVGLAALGLAACTSTHLSTRPIQTPASQSQSASGSGATTAPTPPPTTTPPVATVGDTIKVQGSVSNSIAEVTLNQVLDPAPTTDTPNARDRYVATKFTIGAVSSVSDDANTDVSVQGSNNQVYTPTFVGDDSACTNFNGGDFDLNPGQSVTGCVYFQIPTGVTVTTVDFGLDSMMGGTQGQWQVSS